MLLRLRSLAPCILFALGGCTPAQSALLESTGSSGDGDGDCSDGHVVAPEACDDGNQVDGDGCNSDCQPSGSLIWCKGDLGDDGGDNVGNAVAVDNQGNTIVVGQMHDGVTASPRAFVAKYATDGALLWLSQIPDERQARGLAIRPEGIVVTTETAIVRLTAAGELAQTGAKTEGLAFARNGLALGPSGDIAFAANTIAAEPCAVAGVIGDDLEIEWQQTWDGEGTKTRANAIGHDAAGSLLLGGTVLVELVVDTPDVGPREISAGFVRKYAPDGALLWATTLPSPDESLGLIVTAVRAGEGDETVVLGFLSADTPISAPNMTVTTLDADGSVQNQLVLDNPERAAYGSDMSLAMGGDRIIAGTVYPQEIAPAYGSVIRLDAAGQPRWKFSSTLLPVNSSLFHALSRPASGTFAAAGMQSLGAGNSRALVCVLRE